MMNFENIYEGRRVLVTGHTGFKGAWLSIWLKKLGAKVTGFSLPKYYNDYVFSRANLNKRLNDERGDIRDIGALRRVFKEHQPEIVFHLAAQPLVRLSYEEPVMTFETNVLGSANVLEAVRGTPSVKAVVMVTSDKCYKNKERFEGYSETDELGGGDPYSASKACAELVIESYRRSFCKNTEKLIASVRAGNTLGGGDWAKDRLVPDCIRALKANKEIDVRNPNSTRPWQHVLEPLNGYLKVGQTLLEGKEEFAEAWNFGPKSESIKSVKEVVEEIICVWGKGGWKHISSEDNKHEAKLLGLDITKARKLLGWSPIWDFKETMEMTVKWYKREDKENAFDLCMEQIEKYQKDVN